MAKSAVLHPATVPERPGAHPIWYVGARHASAWARSDLIQDEWGCCSWRCSEERSGEGEACLAPTISIHFPVKAASATGPCAFPPSSCGSWTQTRQVYFSPDLICIFGDHSVCFWPCSTAPLLSFSPAVFSISKKYFGFVSMAAMLPAINFTDPASITVPSAGEKSEGNVLNNLTCSELWAARMCAKPKATG